MSKGPESGKDTPSGSILKNRPLRVDIMTAFTGLLLITVMIMIFFAYYRNSKTVLDLTDDLIHDVHEMVVKEAVIFLRPVSTVARLSSGMASNFDLALPDNEGFESYAMGVS